MRDGRGGILGYGIQVGFSSQSVTISGNSFFECRHAVTTGTGTKSGRTPNCGVSRGLAIIGNSVSYCTNTGLDTHEDSDGVTISGNTIVACTPVAIHVRSFGSTITGNTISACRGKGIRISKTAKNSVASANVIRNIRRRSSDGVCREFYRATCQRRHYGGMWQQQLLPEFCGLSGTDGRAVAAVQVRRRLLAARRYWCLQPR